MTFMFSIIVPTLNRVQELEALLISIRNQSFKNYEVIIIDQNRDNRLDNIVASFVNNCDIKHLKVEKKGASNARNIGIENASGSVLTFPDDDCEFPGDLLTKISDIFRTHEYLDGISIPARDKHEVSSVARLSTRGGKITRSNVLRRTIEAGIYIKREIIADTRFDEELGVGAKTPWWSDEGADFILRLIYNGATVEYMPHLHIYHPDPISVYDQKAITRSFKYGCGRGKFLQKHRYPLWYVFYVWSLYIAGAFIGLFQFNIPKSRFYLSGLRGRIKGYLC